MEYWIPTAQTNLLIVGEIVTQNYRKLYFDWEGSNRHPNILIKDSEVHSHNTIKQRHDTQLTTNLIS